MSLKNNSVEWADSTKTLVDELEEESSNRTLTREERALVDIVDTVQLLTEGDGLHDFWQSALTHIRIINSFDMAGASALVDVLTASQWCQTRNEDRAQYSETESDHLAGIEEELHEALAALDDQVSEFIEDELSD